MVPFCRHKLVDIQSPGDIRGALAPLLLRWRRSSSLDDCHETRRNEESCCRGASSSKGILVEDAVPALLVAEGGGLRTRRLHHARRGLP